MKNTFLSRFTPSLMSPQALEDIFVQRQVLAQHIVELIRESVLTQSKHYTLLIGSRGIGKTHLVSLVYHRVCKIDELHSGLLIAWLREEEWGVASFLDLLLRIFRALQEEYRDGKKLILGLAERVEALYQMPPEVAERTATLMLKEVIGNCTLLLLMENLDELFAGLGEEGQLQLRAFLQENSCCTIVATSQSLFNGVKLQTSPFYGFFRIRHLMDLTSEEATQLLANIANLEGKTDLEEFICTPSGRDRIRAVHHLAGGSPRLYVIFSEFLTRESLDELQEPFMRMLDDLTPYYQARMQWLSPQQRKIVEFLSDCRHAVPVKEIAQRCFISHQTVSSQLKDLREMGYVTSEAIGRESFYELREPLMRFCLEVKKQRGEPIRLFVDFLRLWYTKEELHQRLRFENIKRDKVRDDFRQNFSETLIDSFLQEENNHKYQQRLEPLPSDALVDREYVLRALEAMEEGDNEDPMLAAYGQEYKNLTDNKDYVTALQYAEKLIEKRGWGQDWVLKGDCLNKLKRYEEALASCDKAIEIDPNCTDTWVKRGWVLGNLKRYEEALASCAKAIELDPNYKNTWLGRGWVLGNLKRYEEALASCDKAIEFDPNYTDAWLGRGIVLGNLKRYEEALASYDKAIEIDPNYTDAWANRGLSLNNLNRYEEALASYDKTIEIDPSYKWAWANRGLSLNNLNRYEEALASYDKAIEIDPSYKWAWANRGLSLNNLNRYEEALASYDKAIEIDPNYTDAWANRGLSLNNLNRYEEALASYDKAIEIDPSYKWAWVRRGLSLNNLNRYEEALASYDKAIEIDPSYEWAWANRGLALNNLKRYEEALISCSKAIEINPNYEYAWANRGLALNNLKRYEEALISCSKAIEINPNYEYAWTRRGLVLEDLKRYEEALFSCNKAIEINPNYDYAWVRRGLVLNNLKRYEEALISCNKVIEINPNHEFVWVMRSLVINNLKRYEEALISCNKAIEINPNYDYAWVRRGSVLEDLKRYEEALISCNKAIEINPNYEFAWVRRGSVLEDLKRYEEALASYDKAIELNPNYEFAWIRRGSVLEDLKCYEEALASYDKAIELNPSDKWAFKARGSLLNDLTRYKEALVYFNKAIEIDRNYEAAWGSRSWTLINLGHYEEALASCDKAISLGEKKYYVLANRAISLMGLNLWEKGVTAVEDAFKSLKDGKEASAEDTELIFRILFVNIQDALTWKTHITTLMELFNKYQSISALSQGLVRSIPALIPDTVSDKAAQLWLEVWQELVGSRSEFQISLRLLNAAVRYRVTKGDRRVLLELPIEERNLLKPLLHLGETSN